MGFYKTFSKAPAERLDFSVDYSRELSRLGDAISSSLWIVPSVIADDAGNQDVSLDDGVAVDYGADPSPSFSLGGTLKTDMKATIFLSGGTLGTEYLVENRILTAGGRRYSRKLAVQIVEKSS